MAGDYFPDGYFANNYWASGYFQAGEGGPAGDVQANISGLASISATISAAGVNVIQGGRRKRKRQLIWSEVKPTTIQVYAVSHIATVSFVSASASAGLAGASNIIGTSDLIATGETIDIYALEAEFWLMAA